MMRTGLLWSIAAVGSAVGCLVVIVLTATVVADLAFMLALMGVAIFLGGLLLGSSVLIGSASFPVLIGASLEAFALDEPTWVRSLVIACLWFVTAELGWEAIDRRVAAEVSSGVTFRRVQEVGTVIAVTLGVTVIAIAAQSLAPVRTLPIQAIVIGGFLVAFVAAARRLATLPTSSAGD